MPSNKGFKIFIARDGSEALEILKKDIPDVVLLDIMMPNVGGNQTLKHIKNTVSLNTTKVVFLSAKNKLQILKKG